MLDLLSAVAVLVLAAMVALTGFGGKHVSDEPAGAPLSRRITRRGYLFLSLSACVLALKLAEEYRRHQSLSGNLPDGFNDLTEEVTGYSGADWNRYIAVRLSLRYQLGKLYKQKLGGEPPESIAKMLAALTERGTVPEELCTKLDYIRESTYPFEWGRGTHQSPPDLAKVRRTAKQALNELAALTAAAPLAPPSTKSACVESLRARERIPRDA
jgi:hypothetical protein